MVEHVRQCFICTIRWWENMNRRAFVALSAALVVGLMATAGIVGAVSSSTDSNYAQNDVSFFVACADGIGTDGTTQQVTDVDGIVYQGTVVGVTYSSSASLDKAILKAGNDFYVFNNPAQSGSVSTDGGTIDNSLPPNNPCGDKDDEEKFNRDEGTTFTFEDPED